MVKDPNSLSKSRKKSETPSPPKRTSRRAKTDRVPRTRAGETWTEAAFWGFLRAGLRRMSLRWPPRKQAELAIRRKYVGPNVRQKWEYQCAQCGGWYMGKEIEVDHIHACGTLKSFSDLPGFVERLFCEQDGFQVLCKVNCHGGKTRTARKDSDVNSDTATSTASDDHDRI